MIIYIYAFWFGENITFVVHGSGIQSDSIHSGPLIQARIAIKPTILMDQCQKLKFEMNVSDRNGLCRCLVMVVQLILLFDQT